MSDAPSQRPWRFRLSTRLVGWFIAFTCLPLSVAIFTTYRTYEATLRHEVSERLFAIADGISAQIEAYALSRIEDVQVLATAPGLKAAMVRLMATGDVMSPDETRMLRVLLEHHRQHHGFSDVLLVSAGGVLLFSLENTLPPGADLEQGPFVDSDLARTIDDARTLQSSAVSHLTLQEGVPGSPAFIAAPVYSSTKKFLGLVAVRLDKADVYRWAADFTGLGETGEIVLGSLTSKGIVMLAPLRHDPEAAFQRLVMPAASNGQPLQQAVQGLRGQGLATDYRGQEVLARWAYLPAFDWGLVVKIDSAEAFAPIRQLRIFILLLTGFTALGAGGVALLAARSIAHPIRRLTEATRAVAAGRLEQRVNIQARHEVGELAYSFNKMAADLEASTRSLRDLNDSLEQQVAERTRSLEAHARELVRSNQELERFAYVASHDLQEPLRTVASYVQLLQRRYASKLDADADTFIAYAVEGSKRMQALIQDLLAYSRVGREVQPFRLEPLEDVLAEALAGLAQLAEETKAVVSHDALPQVCCNRGQISQLLSNLIGNALKFRRPEEPPRVHVGAERVEDGWRLWVRDNGIGIAAPYAERIFVLFQRLHTRDEYPGTGIGLAICKKIVERHGGRIWMESTEGQGSTFSWTLPDSPDEGVTPPPVLR